MSTQAQVERQRRDTLKDLIRRLHQGDAMEGDAMETVRSEVVRLLEEIPYQEVVAAEEELIAEGLPTEEVIRLYPKVLLCKPSVKGIAEHPRRIHPRQERRHHHVRHEQGCLAAL